MSKFLIAILAAGAAAAVGYVAAQALKDKGSDYDDDDYDDFDDFDADDVDFEINDASFSSPRSVTNISGGERFLISLSLALGIADFASRTVRVDSLFLDEGFGSLDGETLRRLAARKTEKRLRLRQHGKRRIEDRPRRFARRPAVCESV